jgi:hypothetical protein
MTEPRETGLASGAQIVSTDFYKPGNAWHGLCGEIAGRGDALQPCQWRENLPVTCFDRRAIMPAGPVQGHSMRLPILALAAFLLAGAPMPPPGPMPAA